MEQQVISQIVLAYLAIGWTIMFFLSRKTAYSWYERIVVIVLTPVAVTFLLILAFLVIALFAALVATAFGL